jgi:RND superfamily putative drug exporter
MVGIGVGIDYALFIVTRYRQGLHDGLDPQQSTVKGITTAGRAVIFAGTTVVDVRHPLRAVDGLRGVPPVTRP